tara:strand:- start:205 stop:771 length:567 start_codon:yes stop_codon:yes gene_type:complete
MKYGKFNLRKKFILLRKKKYLKAGYFNFNLIFNLIKKHFKNKKIIIAAYYPSNYEVNILRFIEMAEKKNFKVVLPVLDSSTKMSFKTWKFKEPLNVNKFGMLEPKHTKRKNNPDLVLVPLVAFDKKLNRIGYGKGYYDRGLKKISNVKRNMISLGVAHSFQQCKRVPTNKHDYKLDYIFTERGIISSN